MQDSKKSPVILAIESSCDDTSAAVWAEGKMLSNIVANQTVHKEYGGVIPELASRAHLENIIPVIDMALKKAELKATELNAIGLTRGPGLLGSLMVGVSFAKSMALSLDIPLIEVNHMQAHVLSHFIEDPKPDFPFLCLTVSGGHTQIVLVRDHLNMEVIGQTRDDAAGEAFDKTGKLLGLDYPSGPIIDKLAIKGKAVFTFPEPKIPGLDFSFSGVKTAILYFLRKELKSNPNFIKENLNNICASVQERIVTILMNKIVKASKDLAIKNIAIAGGVSANSGLRKKVKEMAEVYDWNTFIPKMEYCTDNAAMIAIVAHYKYLKGEFADQSISPLARMKF